MEPPTRHLIKPGQHETGQLESLHSDSTTGTSEKEDPPITLTKGLDSIRMVILY